MPDCARFGQDKANSVVGRGPTANPVVASKPAGHETCLFGRRDAGLGHLLQTQSRSTKPWLEWFKRGLRDRSSLKRDTMLENGRSRQEMLHVPDIARFCQRLPDRLFTGAGWPCALLLALSPSRRPRCALWPPLSLPVVIQSLFTPVALLLCSVGRLQGTLFAWKYARTPV